MPGLKQIGEQSRDVNNKITTKEFQPWTEALHKQACLAKTGFLAFEVHVFYILEVLHTFLVLFCFSIVETCGLDKCSWCCLKTKNTQHGEATQKPSSMPLKNLAVFGFVFVCFPFTFYFCGWHMENQTGKS